MIVPQGREYKGRAVQLDLVDLDGGASVVVQAPPGDEAVVVLLEGSVEWDGRRAGRSSVFDTPAFAVYLPPRCSVEIRAHTATQLALAATVDAGLDADTSDEPLFIAPTDVVVHERGERGWRRAVHDVVGEEIPARRLLVGETFNRPGEWSSFPPHKHDGRDGEPELEEVYYFRFDSPNGFGFQGLYDTDGSERAVFLRHGTVVGIPHGYHPVSSAPGSRLYYLWALAGTPRRLSYHADPGSPV